MRITVTAPGLDGGIARNVLNLVHAWTALGVDVDIVLDHGGGPYVEQIGEQARVFVSGGSNAFSKVPWMARYLRRAQPAGVLTPVPRHTVLVLRARRLSRVSCRVVATVHNNYSVTVRSLSEKKRRSRLKTISAHYPACDAIVAVSRGATDAFAAVTGIPRERLTTIYNPVVTDSLREQARATVQHPWFTRGGGVPVVVNVGRLVGQKNQDLLISAFERIRAYREVRLAIIGEGEERLALEARIAGSRYSEDIQLLGHRPNPYALVSRANAFALSSSWEGFGNVLVEAMALGVPVVSTDCPSGPHEILEGGRWGPLVPVCNADALAAGIVACLDEPLTPQVLMDAAARFEVAMIARQYLEVLLGEEAGI
ncbi:MAG TPA: glycosyltransferase [Gammaproteobacteria bacterium]|nr:glycosyltransferase [Gammaproteobacteria bacterium]